MGTVATALTNKNYKCRQMPRGVGGGGGEDVRAWKLGIDTAIYKAKKLIRIHQQ